MTVPSPGEAWRWPLYGKEEEEAMVQLVREPSYSPIDALESEWRKHFGVPHCKAHCNGTAR